MTTGRMASKAAQILQGKMRPDQQSHVFNVYDQIIIVNGKRPLIYGGKGKTKVYRSHSTYPGGLKERDICQVLDSYNWRKVVEQAISRMLPKNNLRKKWMEKVQVYPDLYHDIDYLPQFQLLPGIDDAEQIGAYDITNPKIKLLAKDEQSEVSFPPELEFIKDLEVTPEEPQRQGAIKRADKVKMKRWYRHLGRYKIFNYDTRKFEL